VNVQDGAIVPPLTNGDAVALVMAWHRVARDVFPLWGQLAATAYGWTADNGMMDVSPRQRDAAYPPQIAFELWITLEKVADTLDDSTTGPGRIEFGETFDNVATQGAVASELKNDGAAQVTFRLAKGEVVAPKRAPAPTTSPLLKLALLYFGYHVIKRITD
jgi:hypothetical protein